MRLFVHDLSMSGVTCWDEAPPAMSRPLGMITFDLSQTSSTGHLRFWFLFSFKFSQHRKTTEKHLHEISLLQMTW